jgi:hypothetical protein
MTTTQAADLVRNALYELDKQGDDAILDYCAQEGIRGKPGQCRECLIAKLAKHVLWEAGEKDAIVSATKYITIQKHLPRSIPHSFPTPPNILNVMNQFDNGFLREFEDDA